MIFFAGSGTKARAAGTSTTSATIRFRMGHLAGSEYGRHSIGADAVASRNESTPRPRQSPGCMIRTSGGYPQTCSCSLDTAPGVLPMLETTKDRAVTHRFVTAVRERVAGVVVGQDNVVERLLIALLTGGHLLLQGMPGLAKTLLVNAVARAVDLKFARVQFTIDLLPSDIVGSEILDQRTGEFRVHRGPVFTNLLLADEINRAAPKVQSALLEAMQERRVTIGNNTFPLPAPFVVAATQNPIEQSGTFELPEAQLDRFMLCHRLHYPDAGEEEEILRRQLQLGLRREAQGAVPKTAFDAIAP